MSETKQQECLPSDGDLAELAIRFVLALQRSASVDVIGRLRWWERAKTALETAASCAESWQQMVSKMGDKLQVQSPVRETALEIEDLGKNLTDPHTFERFRYLCQRDALYIVAMVRARKELLRGGLGGSNDKSDGDD